MAYLHNAHRCQGVDVELRCCHIIHVVRHRNQRLTAQRARVSATNAAALAMW